MKEKYIFSIPIYTCSEEEYDRKRGAYFRKKAIAYPFRDDEQSIKLFKSAFYKYLWRPWKYNQAIGFIEIFIWGKDIRGDLYFETSDRISIYSKKRRFELQGKAFEMGVYFKQEANNIFEMLFTRLENLKREKPYKGRFIDLRLFYEIGPYVNWKALLGY